MEKNEEKNKEKKFTMVELMITVTVLLVIAAVLIPAANSIAKKLIESSDKETQKSEAAIGHISDETADRLIFKSRV